MKLLKIGWIGSFVCAALVYPAAALIGASAVEAWIVVNPYDESTVKLNRLGAPLPGEEDFDRKVAKIYGQPMTESIKVVFVSESKLLRPPEKPSLAIVRLDQEKREDVLQLQTIDYARPRVVAGAVVVGLVLWAAWTVVRRRRAASPAPPSPPTP